MRTEYNRVAVAGRVTADAVRRQTRNGRSVSHFYLTTRHQRPTGEIETSSFQITAFGDVADRCAALRVGQAVLVEGRLHEDRWMGRDDRRRSKVVIVAERVHLIRESVDTCGTEDAITLQRQRTDHRQVIACTAEGPGRAGWTGRIMNGARA